MPRRGGWRRRGKKRFRYEDARGETITDPAKLARIDELVIPPAWQEVWISPNPGAKLQATGIDAAGRQQYLYHPDFRAAQEQAKYDGLVRFGELLPGLRAAVASHVRLDPLSAEWTLAHAVTLINRSWFRVGSETYARGSRTYGVSTLLKRHVDVRGSRLRFTFRAKHRTLVRATPRRSRARRRDQGARQPSRRVAPVPVRGRGRPPQPDRAAPERVSRRAPRRRIHGEGLPHVGREPHGGGRPGRARPAVVGDRRDAGDRSGDAAGGGRARQHSRGRARVVREPGGARAVPRRTHPRSLSRPHAAAGSRRRPPGSTRRSRASSACCARGASAARSAT